MAAQILIPPLPRSDRCYQEALERQTGDHMISPRVHHNVSETLESIGGYPDALKHERLSHAG